MDVGRAMLKFGVGYPLGKKGLDWLKIHCITLQGAKKKSGTLNSPYLYFDWTLVFVYRESLEGRLEYANKILDDITDSADNPLMVSI